MREQRLIVNNKEGFEFYTFANNVDVTQRKRLTLAQE
jgi:hypothetical protein